MNALLVRDLVEFLDRLYPPTLAEEWDAVGLSVGDPEQPVRRVYLAVDAVAATVDEAVAAGADLLLTHHPLLLRGVTSVAADTAKGALVHRLIRSGTALFTAHTNADRARHGVNDALAAAAGLTDTEPLVPANDRPLDKLVTFVPHDRAQPLIDALAAAGAGAIGDYSRCAFTSTGLGTFLPGPAAVPTIGTPGRIEEVPETRVEMVLDRSKRTAVLAALRGAHPYEEPAFDLLAMADLPGDTGLGRIGRLARPTQLSAFVAALAARLPATAVGLRVSGRPDRRVHTVAVVGGAGDSTIGPARTQGADVLVTADLRHHPALDNADVGGPALVDPGHWAGEWPWLDVLAGLLRTEFADALEVVVSHVCTDPWTPPTLT